MVRQVRFGVAWAEAKLGSIERTSYISNCITLAILHIPEFDVAFSWAWCHVPDILSMDCVDLWRKCIIAVASIAERHRASHASSHISMSFPSAFLHSFSVSLAALLLFTSVIGSLILHILVSCASVL